MTSSHLKKTLGALMLAVVYVVITTNHATAFASPYNASPVLKRFSTASAGASVSAYKDLIVRNIHDSQHLTRLRRWSFWPFSDDDEETTTTSPVLPHTLTTHHVREEEGEVDGDEGEESSGGFFSGIGSYIRRKYQGAKNSTIGQAIRRGAHRIKNSTIGRAIRRGVNATRRRVGRIGQRLKEGARTAGHAVRAGYRKIRRRLTGEQKFRQFMEHAREGLERKDNTTVAMLNRLGISVAYNGNGTAYTTVRNNTPTVNEILLHEGLMTLDPSLVLSTTPANLTTSYSDNVHNISNDNLDYYDTNIEEPLIDRDDRVSVVTTDHTMNSTLHTNSWSSVLSITPNSTLNGSSTSELPIDTYSTSSSIINLRIPVFTPTTPSMFTVSNQPNLGEINKDSEAVSEHNTARDMTIETMLATTKAPASIAIHGNVEAILNEEEVLNNNYTALSSIGINTVALSAGTNARTPSVFTEKYEIATSTFRSHLYSNIPNADINYSITTTTELSTLLSADNLHIPTEKIFESTFISTLKPIYPDNPTHVTTENSHFAKPTTLAPHSTIENIETSTSLPSEDHHTMASSTTLLSINVTLNIFTTAATNNIHSNLERTDNLMPDHFSIANAPTFSRDAGTTESLLSVNGGENDGSFPSDVNVGFYSPSGDAINENPSSTADVAYESLPSSSDNIENDSLHSPTSDPHKDFPSLSDVNEGFSAISGSGNVESESFTASENAVGNEAIPSLLGNLGNEFPPSSESGNSRLLTPYGGGEDAFPNPFADDEYDEFPSPFGNGGSDNDDMPFPDVFSNTLVRDRLREIYANGDFSHDDLRNAFNFNPNDYHYYYDYEY